MTAREKSGIAMGSVMLHFAVNPDTTAQSTTLRFLAGGKAEPDAPGVENNITAYGLGVEPETLESTVTIDGILNILPDVSAFFIRGDANGDRNVNITDPTFILNYLFKSTDSPPCLDAADANDDGNINLTDPISILQVLFRGQSELPEPFDAPGADPTEDALECREGIQ